MSYVKTDWVNNDTKVNGTNMNHIEQGIYNNDTAIGNMSNLETTASDLVSAINEVDGKTITYSTTEFETNEIYVIGDTSYRAAIKFFTINIGTATTFNIAHNISVDSMFKIWFDQANSWWVTPTVSETLGHYNGADDYSRFYLTTSNISASFASIYNTMSKTAYITLKYLKEIE